MRTFFLRNDHTVFTMGGIVALRSQHVITGELQTCSYVYLMPKLRPKDQCFLYMKTFFTVITDLKVKRQP